MSIKVEKTDKNNEVKLSFTIEAAKFEEAILNKIGSRIDTEEIEKEIPRIEGNLFFILP